MPFIRWDRPRGTVHSVATALGFGEGGCNVLALSDAALYVVQNFLGLDLEFKSRWADEEYPDGYVPISEDSPNFSAWLDMIGRIQAEGNDMACDLVKALTDILDELDSSGMLLDALISRLTSSQEGAASQSYLETHPYYDPPSGVIASPENDEARCQRSWSFVTNWKQANVEAHLQSIQLGQLGIGLLAIIFSLLEVPLVVILGIAAVIVEAAILIDHEVYDNVLTSAMPDLACAIYSASTSATAVSAARAVIDDLPTLNQATRDMLAAQVSNLVIDKVFDETYPILSGMPTDCSACEAPACEDVLIDEFGDDTLAPWVIIVQQSNISFLGCQDQAAKVVCGSGGSGTTNAADIQIDLGTPWEIPAGGYVNWRRKTDVITSQNIKFDFVDNPGNPVTVAGSGNLGAAADWTIESSALAAEAGREVYRIIWHVNKATGPYVAWLDWVDLACSA